MSDESLFREVDEEVRQEQFQKLWKRYGHLITAACVAVIVAVAAFKGWQYWQVKQAEEAGAAFFQALQLEESGKPEEAAKLMATIGHSGYGQLARLRAAAELAAAGKRDEAIVAYDRAAGDSALDPVLRDLARIRVGYLLVDTLKPDELEAHVGGLNTPEGQWRNPAREVLGLSAYRIGDYAAADRYMSAIIADPQATPAMRQRAQIVMQLVAPLMTKPATP